jgi:hypothetical protein
MLTYPLNDQTNESHGFPLQEASKGLYSSGRRSRANDSRVYRPHQHTPVVAYFLKDPERVPPNDLWSAKTASSRCQAHFHAWAATTASRQQEGSRRAARAVYCPHRAERASAGPGRECVAGSPFLLQLLQHLLQHLLRPDPAMPWLTRRRGQMRGPTIRVGRIRSGRAGPGPAGSCVQDDVRPGVRCRVG